MHSKGKTVSLTQVRHEVQRKGPKYSSGFAGWSSKPWGKFQLQLLFPAVEGETLPSASLEITLRTKTKAEQLGKSYCPRTHSTDPTVPWIKETKEANFSIGAKLRAELVTVSLQKNWSILFEQRKCCLKGLVHPKHETSVINYSTRKTFVPLRNTNETF